MYLDLDTRYAHTVQRGETVITIFVNVYIFQVDIGSNGGAMGVDISPSLEVPDDSIAGPSALLLPTIPGWGREIQKLIDPKDRE